MVADLAGRDVILAPLLMADGYTLKAMQKRLAPITSTLGSLNIAPPLGAHAGLADQIVAAAKKACRDKNWLLDQTDLLIAAHGTRRDPNSGKSAFDHVDTIRAQNLFAGVRTGFLDQDPTLKPRSSLQAALAIMWWSVCSSIAANMARRISQDPREDRP